MLLKRRFVIIMKFRSWNYRENAHRMFIDLAKNLPLLGSIPPRPRFELRLKPKHTPAETMRTEAVSE